MTRPTNKNPFGSICFECGALIRLKQSGNKWKQSETLNTNYYSTCQNDIHKPTLIFHTQIEALKIKRTSNSIYWDIYQNKEYSNLNYNELRLLSIKIASKNEGYILN